MNRHHRMLLQQIVAALCALSLATATPLLRLHHFGQPGAANSTPPRHSAMHARNILSEHGKIGGITMCTGPNFSGDCKYTQLNMNTCYALPPPFKSNIASFRPDQAFGGAIPGLAFGCRLYGDETCSAGNVRFEYPGVSIGRLWVDPKSVRCEFYNPAALNLYKWLLDS